MAVKDSLLRYAHIVNKLRAAPATRQEIMHFLRRKAEWQGRDFDISERTFKRDLEDIETLFQVAIRYDFRRKVYYINEEGGIDHNRSLLEAFDTLNMLGLSEGLSKHIFFERRKPRGTEHLHGLLHAIRNKFQVAFDYKKYWDPKPSHRLVEPLALRESQNIWYLVAREPQRGDWKVFGLDRLSNLDITRKKFSLGEPVDVESMFTYCFGVDCFGSEKPETVELSFDAHEGNYIKALPLHETQEIIVDNTEELRIRLKIHISYDFIMQIRSRGNRVNVIKPASLRKEIIKNLHETLSLYDIKK